MKLSVTTVRSYLVISRSQVTLKVLGVRSHEIAR